MITLDIVCFIRAGKDIVLQNVQVCAIFCLFIKSMGACLCVLNFFMCCNGIYLITEWVELCSLVMVLVFSHITYAG